jgi:coenzyme F420-dependent glucose-6-phosphate dehydrogenase
MPEIGYALSSEEWSASDLVALARRAEDAGFEFALVSDHFHPWVDAQGQSPFVWSVLGGIATATDRLRVGTGVTCPILRIHPAIIAQAAATVATMMPGRFFLGVGSGENLNEHILGDRWPAPHERLERLREAIEVMRLLWQGGVQSFEGRYYDVDRARIYSLPEEPPPIFLAAGASKSAALAGEIGDGLISTAPEKKVVDAFSGAGGKRKPRYGQFTVCLADDEAEARRIAKRIWPNAAVPGDLSWELATPQFFEQASEAVTEETIAESVICGSDAAKHVEMIEKFADAGFDHVYVHQVGPNQEALFRLYEQEILPRFNDRSKSRRSSARTGGDGSLAGRPASSGGDRSRLLSPPRGLGRARSR